jgi:hypothetical protein
MFDVVGGVVVHPVEVVGAFDKTNFFGCPFWETGSELFAHGGWIIAEVDGVGEPGDGEFEFAFGGFHVEGVVRVPRVDTVT